LIFPVTSFFCCNSRMFKVKKNKQKHGTERLKLGSAHSFEWSPFFPLVHSPLCSFLWLVTVHWLHYLLYGSFMYPTMSQCFLYSLPPKNSISFTLRVSQDLQKEAIWLNS
jgi:hypothetical protein